MYAAEVDEMERGDRRRDEEVEEARVQAAIIVRRHWQDSQLSQVGKEQSLGGRTRGDGGLDVPPVLARHHEASNERAALLYAFTQPVFWSDLAVEFLKRVA